jgi:serine/threonine-protein kinase
LLDDDAPGEHHARTARSILTPDYAAPEQLLGGEITTATDVYALGVVAHELLLGARPGRGVSGRMRDETANVRLRGDLDNVLRKALAEDATVRYPDAAALGEDLQRFLDARPVQAHPPSGWYRARKFVRRHRGGVAITVLLTLGMLVSLGVALWQAHAARQQTQRAQEVQDFIESLFAPVEQGQALTLAPTVTELVERGVTRLAQTYPEDSLVRADLLALFARIQLARGEFARGRNLAADAERATLTTYGEHDPRSMDAGYVHGEILRRLGEYDAALTVFENWRERMAAADAHGLDHARLLDAISAIHMERGMPGQQAIALKHAALRERERDPRVTETDLATGYNNLGWSYQYSGAFDDALTWYAKALTINERVRPQSRATAVNLLNIGLTLGYAGRWREALTTLEQSRANFAHLPLTQHPALAQNLAQLCRIHTELEQFDAAQLRCDEAVAMSEAVQGPDHANTIWALSRRVETAYAAGRIADGDADLARAQAANARSSGDRNYNDTILDGVRARHLRAQRKAVELRDVALYLLSDASGLSRRGKSPSEMHLEAYVAWGCALAPDPPCAGHGPARVHALFDDPRFVRSAQRLSAMNMLAEIALHEGRPSDAIAELRDAPERFAELLGAGHSQIALAHWLRAAAHERLGDTEAARAERTRARSLLDALPATHPLRLSLESAH